VSAAPLPGTVLHAVSATRGAYSDRSVWTVAVYVDRTLAEKHRALAQAEGERRVKAFDESDFDYSILEAPNPYDNDNGGENTSHSSEAPIYYVELLFVHTSIEAYATTEQVLLDYAREQGWVP